MKNFMVSLELYSDDLSLDSLCALFQLEATTASYSKGDPRGRGKPCEITAWRLFSQAADESELADHIDDLKARIIQLSGHSDLIKQNEIRVRLNIAVVTDFVAASYIIDHHMLSLFAHLIQEDLFSLEVTHYQSSED